MTFMEKLDPIFDEISKSLEKLARLAIEAVEKIIDTLTLAVRHYIYGDDKVVDKKKLNIRVRIKLWLRKIFMRGKSNHHYMEAFKRRNYR